MNIKLFIVSQQFYLKMSFLKSVLFQNSIFITKSIGCCFGLNEWTANHKTGSALHYNELSFKNALVVLYVVSIFIHMNIYLMSYLLV